jgi:hypothetical protein
MYEIDVDKEKNRLTIVLQGTISKAEALKANREIVSAVTHLKRGFDVINDISKYETTEKKNEELFVQSIKFLKMRGVNNVIRVVGNSKEALVKFATVTKEVAQYNVKYVPTMEDAEELLERG